MKSITIFALLTVVLIGCFGCTKGNNVTSPNIPRKIQDFGLDPIEIFGSNTDGSLSVYFHDIDLSTIESIPWTQAPLDPTECAAVTLTRVDNTPDHPFKPVFRWLDTDNGDEGEDPMYVAERDADDEDDDADYRALACDAAVINGSVISTAEPEDITFIELAVAYQIKDSADQGLSSSDWDIGVTILQWYGQDIEDFYEDEPDERYDMLLPGSTWDSKDEYNPDICYNPVNGDIYVVYSQQQANGVDVYLNYKRYDRETGNITTNTYRAQSEGHNGYNPSVDIGLVDVGTMFPKNYVVVAYTSQNKVPGGNYQTEHNGYHVCVTTWDPTQADTNQNTGYDLMNTNHAYKDAGLPCIDIAPNTNAEHIVGLTYTQVVGSDGFGLITKVFGVQFSNGVIDTHQPIDEVVGATDEYDDGMYSSISINNEPDTGDPVLASITFMAQLHNENILHPRAALVNVDTPSVVWNQWVDNIDIEGNYNIGEIPFINPGVSTAIVAEDEHYWAAWSERIEMEPPPQEIWASKGFAGPD